MIQVGYVYMVRGGGSGVGVVIVVLVGIVVVYVRMPSLDRIIAMRTISMIGVVRVRPVRGVPVYRRVPVGGPRLASGNVVMLLSSEDKLYLRLVSVYCGVPVKVILSYVCVG
jgi:hypothetical protein